MSSQSKIESMAIYDYIRDYLPAIPILELKKGEYLFRADRDDGLLFYILEGVVRVENVSYNGKKLIVDVLQEDEFTGSISNIHHADFQCSGIAETDVRCWVLKKSLMNELLENVEFSALFYQKTSKRVYMMYKRILARTLFGQHENLAYYILDNSENDYFEYKSIYNMCEVLGISRRGIYNILYRFEENGYIEKQGQKYRISDRKSLEAAAGQVMDFMKTEDG